MLLFIVDDLFGIKIWGENIFRRVLHHLSNNNFNSNKNNLIHRINNLLSFETINQLKTLNLPNYNRLNNSFFAKYEGNYSKKSTLYFTDFDKETQNYLLSIGEELKPIFENTLNEKLDMGESDFKAMIIRYEGKESKFSMHYDTENPDCYRSLILYRGEGIVPPFCYTEKDKLIKVNLQPGDGIIFKGTQTYHGVFPSGDDNTVRYMLGFQYKKKGTKEQKSLCSELRNETYFGIFLLFLPFFIYYIILSILDNKLLNLLKIKNNYSKILCVLSFIFIIIGYNYSNSYGTKIVHSFESIIRFYFFILLFTFNPILSFILVGYFIITEMIKNNHNPSNYLEPVTI
jgi:hypothetical protein